MKRNTQEKGITLVALVVTIVILLILAGITISYVFGDNSIFKKASDAKIKTEIARVREKIEVVLTSVQIEKQINSKYNKNDFLDEYILDHIERSEVIDDIVIVDNYAFSIDRSVQKISEYIGKREELIFPEISVTTPILSEDNKTASFTVNAREKENGIRKIEIWQNGKLVQSPLDCENSKEMITHEFVVKYNGTYTIKVYSKVTGSYRVKIEGIFETVQFNPNGSTVYEKEHITKVMVRETTDGVKSLKYQWLKTQDLEPAETTFKEICSNNSLVKGEKFTGEYYLWVLLEKNSGEKDISRSEPFYFDNEGPNVELNFVSVSENSFKLIANATDAQSGIAEYKFYVDNTLMEVCSETIGEASYTWKGTEMTQKDCYVLVIDRVGNEAKKSISARTLQYSWWTYEVIEEEKLYFTNWILDRSGTLKGSAEFSGGWITGEPYINDLRKCS